NTLYKVGLAGVGSGVFLAAQGGRSCDGDTAECQSRNVAGGWGPYQGDSGEWIPNRSVYVYNNIFYNPAPFQTVYSQFDIHGPASPPLYTNIPSPAAADTDLRIRGNIIWNGPADFPIGVEDSSSGCQAQNPTCNEQQLLNDNIFNVFEPQFVSPGTGDFRPVGGGNVLSVAAVQIPDFTGNDRPSPPLAPDGNYSNSVGRDYAGGSRMPSGPPGAYAGSGAPLAQTYSVSGTVTNPAGNALAGVAMTLSGDGSAAAVTDSTGAYSFRGLTAGGSYTVTPLRKKFVFTPSNQTVSGIEADRVLNFVGRKRKH
ncbi:MAG: carboxypeptidase-like regulatory domain-containing protein, partial [Blastocatellia bacterium]